MPLLESVLIKGSKTKGNIVICTDENGNPTSYKIKEVKGNGNCVLEKLNRGDWG